MGVLAGCLVLGGEALEHLDLRGAFFDDVSRVGSCLKLACLEIGLGGKDHVGLKSTLLQLDALKLELLLSNGTGFGTRNLCLFFRSLGNAVEFSGTDTKLVALFDDLTLSHCLSDLGPLLGLGFSLLSFCLLLRFGNTSGLQHVGSTATTNGIEIANFIGDVLNLQDVEFEAKSLDVIVGFFDEELGELEAILVDLFRGQGCEDTTQVCFEGFLGDLGDRLVGHVQETLNRVGEQRVLARNLDVGNALHVQRDGTLGVGVKNRHLEWDVVEVHPRDLFDQRLTDRKSALDRSIADLSAIGIG